jgi:hypothetical protein
MQGYRVTIRKPQVYEGAMALHITTQLYQYNAYVIQSATFGNERFLVVDAKTHHSITTPKLRQHHTQQVYI